MGVKKKREAYFVEYYGVRYEVSEEIYRTWAYFTNKEAHGLKQYSPRLVHGPNGDYVVPSRLVHYEDYIADAKYSQYNPSVLLEQFTVTQILLRCIAALPEIQSKVITLLFFEGYSEQVVAEILGVCQSSVSNYKLHALVTLKKLLLAEGYTEHDLFSMLHS